MVQVMLNASGRSLDPIYDNYKQRHIMVLDYT